MTGNQESFAQHVANGMNHTDAYKAAGYTWETMLPETLWNNAYQLTQVSGVSARITELKQAVAEASVEAKAWTLDKQVSESAKNVKLGRELGQIAASNGALTNIGKLTGALVEVRTPLQVTQVTIVLSDLRQAMPVTEGEVTPSAEDGSE